MCYEDWFVLALVCDSGWFEYVRMWEMCQMVRGFILKVLDVLFVSIIGRNYVQDLKEMPSETFGMHLLPPQK